MVFAPITSSQSTQAFMLPGITHSSKFLEPWQNALKQEGVSIALYHDPRYFSLTYFDLTSDKREQVTQKLNNITKSKPPSLEEMASKVAQELFTEFPNQSTYIVILYSFDCYLAPFLQKIFNKQGRSITFVLADQPTLKITNQQTKLQTLKKVQTILEILANTKGYPAKEKTEDDLKRIANCTTLNESILQLFNELFPDFPRSQLFNLVEKEKLTPDEQQVRDNLLITISDLGMCLSNLRSLYAHSTPYTESNSALLENAVVISTRRVCTHYECETDLGWRKQTKTLKVVSLQHADHLQIFDPCGIESEIVKQAIRESANSHPSSVPESIVGSPEGTFETGSTPESPVGSPALHPLPPPCTPPEQVEEHRLRTSPKRKPGRKRRACEIENSGGLSSSLFAQPGGSKSPDQRARLNLS